VLLAAGGSFHHQRWGQHDRTDEVDLHGCTHGNTTTGQVVRVAGADAAYRALLQRLMEMAKDTEKPSRELT
jgi:hypothetical protein